MALLTSKSTYSMIPTIHGRAKIGLPTLDQMLMVEISPRGRDADQFVRLAHSHRRHREIV